MAALDTIIEVAKRRPVVDMSVIGHTDTPGKAELNEALLDLNPSVPLSSFGRVGKHYVLTGALSASARAEDVAHEVAVLSDNALDALDALADYLR